MFTSILSTGETASLGTQEVFICTAVSLLLGGIISLIFRLIGESSKSFRTALVVLPVLVQAVIMMVNGNLGTSVAVLGAFGLVRFRSIPGTSKEICGVFFTMAVGLATAMGCIAFACMITLVVGAVFILLEKLHKAGSHIERTLRVTIPENLDYTNVFDDIIEQYMEKAELERVKTTNMGTMFDLSYKVVLKKNISEKAMIDAIRCKNGNLTVICSRVESDPAEL